MISLREYSLYPSGDIHKPVIGIVGLRSYTLQEAYNIFGWRSYTSVRRKKGTGSYVLFRDHHGFERGETKRDMFIDGIVISSGQIEVRIKQRLDTSGYAYFTLDELARDFEWHDGSPCGMVLSNSV
jgi:hypothetical protein